jgi:CheY-like chemotaxis protein
MNLNILVAEPNNEDWTAIAKGIRRRLPNASLLRVKDGEQALRFTFRAGLLTPDPQIPHLVLLAARLAVISGERVLDQLRQDPRTRSTPVLLAWKDGYNAKLEKIEAFRGDEWLFTVFCTMALEDQIADAVRRLYDIHGPTGSEVDRPRPPNNRVLRII